MQHGLMPKDDVRAMIDQLVRPAPAHPSPSHKDIGGQCLSPLPAPAEPGQPLWKEESSGRGGEEEMEYIKQIRSLHDCISKQKVQVATSEAELSGTRQQLLQAAEQMDSLEVELADLRQLAADLKGSLSQSEADKAVLMAELEKQLRERDGWAAKCAQLEAERGEHDLQLAELQAKVAELSISQLQAQQRSGDTAAQKQASKIRSDLHCLLHRLTLYEGGAGGDAPSAAVNTAATSIGSGSLGKVNPACAVTPLATTVDPEPLGMHSCCVLPSEQRSWEQPAGIQSSCEAAAERHGKEMIVPGVGGAAADLIALMPTPCRTTVVQRHRVTPSCAVSVPGASVHAGSLQVPPGASMAPPVAAVVAQPRWPQGIATAGGALSLATSPRLGSSQARQQPPDSPVVTRRSMHQHQRIYSSSPKRRYSYTLTPRLSLRHGMVSNTVQVQTGTTVPTLSPPTLSPPTLAPPTLSAPTHSPRRTSLHATWPGFAPPMCATCAAGQ